WVCYINGPNSYSLVARLREKVCSLGGYHLLPVTDIVHVAHHFWHRPARGAAALGRGATASPNECGDVCRRGGGGRRNGGRSTGIDGRKRDSLAGGVGLGDAGRCRGQCLQRRFRCRP